jgi:hypothetical protein
MAKNDSVVKMENVVKVLTFKGVNSELAISGKDMAVPVYWQGQVIDRRINEFPTVDGQVITWNNVVNEEVTAEYSFTYGGYMVLIGKANKVSSCYMVKDDIPQFGSLTAQGMFKVLHQMTGISISKADDLYKAAVGRKVSAVVKQQVGW